MDDDLAVGVAWASGSRYAIVPEWIADSPDISHVGVRLYVILARYANADGSAHPGRKTLADRLRCSVDTIDRSLAELEAAGAIEIVKRQRADGGQSSNQYILRESAAPPAANEGLAPRRMGAAPRTRERSSNEKCLEVHTSELAVAAPPPTPSNRPASVARKGVTDNEYLLAADVLADFNAAARTRYSGVEWVSKIILRIREYPGVSREGHAAVIDRVLSGKHWWDGDASPSVIYGNGAVFERALHVAARPLDPNRPMSAEELRAHFAERPHGDDTIDGEAFEVVDG